MIGVAGGVRADNHIDEGDGGVFVEEAVAVHIGEELQVLGGMALGERVGSFMWERMERRREASEGR